MRLPKFILIISILDCIADIVAELNVARTKSDKYAASGAEMEKLLDIENKLLFQVEQKLSEAQPKIIIQNHIDSLRDVMIKIENERNLSKILSFVQYLLLTIIRESWKNPKLVTVTERVLRKHPEQTIPSICICFCALNFRSEIALGDGSKNSRIRIKCFWFISISLTLSAYKTVLKEMQHRTRKQLLNGKFNGANSLKNIWVIH